MTSLRTKEERSGQQLILKLLSASPAMRISGPLLDQNDCSVAVAAARQCAKPNTEHRADERSLTDRPHAKRAYLPHLIAWEVTRSCHLNCKHCRAAARFGPYPNELSTEECFHFLDDVASFSRPIMILTGGEPMLREDIFDIAAHGSRLGLRMVMSPCGLLMTEENTRRMLEVGIKRISLSLDGADPATHDGFRGMPGAFEGVMRAVELARQVGMEFQINTTISQHNLQQLPEILALSLRLGAVTWYPFLLVPTGRGSTLVEWEISPEEYEQTLAWIYDQQEAYSIPIKPTCAAHYQRVFRQKAWAQGKKAAGQPHGSAPSSGLDAMTKGCMGGSSFAFVSHVGKVQICGFLETECGDIRKEPFSRIWNTSPVFLEMRNEDGYGGRCGVCEFRRVCGGCRARAFAMTGNYLAEEPFCTYEPRRAKVSEANRLGQDFQE